MSDQDLPHCIRGVPAPRAEHLSASRSEAVILAIFGAIIGTGMGIALLSSLKQQGIIDTAVPVSQLVLFLVLAALLGLLAATWPILTSSTAIS